MRVYVAPLRTTVLAETSLHHEISHPAMCLLHSA